MTHGLSRAVAALFLFVLPLPLFAQDGPPPAPPPHEGVLPNSAFPDLVPPGPPPAPWPPPPAPPADGPLLTPFAGAPWATPAMGHMPFSATYHISWLPDEPVSGQNTHFSDVHQDASVRFPIWQNDRNEVTGSFHVRSDFIHTGAILPDTDQPFPDQLWDIRIGAGYRHEFDNGWIAGVNVNFGSASNEPFHSVNELTAGVNASLRIPSGERNAWLVSLSYSPTGELSFPILGVAFMWVPSDQFRMNIGLPFMIWYRPIEDLTLEASYMLITSVHARATYRICKPVRVYVGFDWSDESWFIVPREDDKERLFYYEQRLSVGALINLGRMFLLDVSTGYVFNRTYFEGQHYSDRNFNRVDIDAAPLLSFQAQLRW